MEKHIKLTGILNLVYSVLAFCAGIFLLFLSILLPHIVSYAVNAGFIDPDIIPHIVVDTVPVFLALISVIILLFAVIGIFGGAALVGKKKWGRIPVLIVSFINLLHIPVGTALGIYSIWILFDEEAIKILNSQ
jgi:hypothetical protein